MMGVTKHRNGGEEEQSHQEGAQLVRTGLLVPPPLPRVVRRQLPASMFQEGKRRRGMNTRRNVEERRKEGRREGTVVLSCKFCTFEKRQEGKIGLNGRAGVREWGKELAREGHRVADQAIRQFKQECEP